MAEKDDKVVWVCRYCRRLDEGDCTFVALRDLIEHLWGHRRNVDLDKDSLIPVDLGSVKWWWKP